MKQIRDYDYEISENGEIINLKNGKTKRQWINSSGYYCVELTIGKKQNKKFLTHRLVAEVYLGLPDDNIKLQIDHINRNRKDNHFSNLRWVTPSENCKNKNENKKKKVKLDIINTIIKMYEDGMSINDIYNNINGV
jgi:hypothetical protein